jgi:5-methylcytosine-specific restriction endonuclease McrA
MKSNSRIAIIYRRTDGFCHLCHKKLALKHYARAGARGAWEIEHSVPRARGGTDHGNNLYAACISCNRSKGKRSTRTARRHHGQTRAPYGRRRKAGVRLGNALAGAGLGAGLGLILGPGAWLAGALFGGLGGHGKAVR